jgi:integrase/recombinase XerD
MAASSTTSSQDLPFSCMKAVYADRSIENGVKAGWITKSDIALIREFVTERKASAGIGLSRVNKITYTLVHWRRFLPEFRGMTIVDVYDGLEALKNAQTRKGTPFKQNTKHDFIRILKQFLTWLVENEYVSLPEKKVRRIKVPNKDAMTKTASEMLTHEEIQRLYKACYRSYDRALITMIYEGGLRIGEAGNMKWKDITFNRNGIVLNVNFKTNIPRYVPIIAGREYIAQWRMDYPGTPEGDSPVFINTFRNRLTNAGANMQIQRIVERAGITKHVTPHIFRHSRITHMVQEGVSESVIKMIMWGSVHSKMLQTYAHLTGKDIDREMRRVYGLESDEDKKQKSSLEPQVCRNCHMIMPPAADYCALCGESLRGEAKVGQDEIQAFVLRHGPELMEYLMQRRDIKQQHTELKTTPKIIPPVIR